MTSARLLLVSCILSVALLEAGLKVLGPVEYENGPIVLIEDSVRWRMADRLYSRPRYSSYRHAGYVSNELGMLDARIDSINARPGIRVAFLGDSFLEARAVPPGKRMTDLIASMGEGRLNPMNFGMSGTGTVEQLALYRSLVSPMRPSVVVLMLYPGNDIVDNVEYDLRRRSGARPGRGHSGIHRRLLSAIRSALPATYVHMYVVKERLRASAGLPVTHVFSERHASYLEVYRRVTRHAANAAWASGRPSLTPGTIEQGWSITERAIGNLALSVERTGAAFLVVILPDPMQPYADDKHSLESLLGVELPSDFDPNLPAARLDSLLSRAGINYLNLADVFRDYASTEHLSPPYFAFEKDGHWDTLGHAVAADTISAALLSIGATPHVGDSAERRPDPAGKSGPGTD